MLVFQKGLLETLNVKVLKPTSIWEIAPNQLELPILNKGEGVELISGKFGFQLKIEFTDETGAKGLFYADLEKSLTENPFLLQATTRFRLQQLVANADFNGVACTDNKLYSNEEYALLVAANKAPAIDTSRADSGRVSVVKGTIKVVAVPA